MARAPRRDFAGRLPRRYPSLEAAFARMKEENGFLTDEQARHLTVHGASRNEDGTWLWVRMDQRQPSSPAKFSLGLLFVGLGFIVMVVAATLSGGAASSQPPPLSRRATTSSTE